MDHFSGHVIESARAQLGTLAFAGKNRITGDHGVRFISGMPMLPHMDRLRRPNEEAGSMRFRINTQKTDFGRAFAEIGNDLVPFQIGHIFENRPIARHRRRLGCLRTNVGQHEERHGEKN